MLNFREEFETIKKGAEKRILIKERHYNSVAENILNDVLSKIITLEDKEIAHIESIILYRGYRSIYFKIKFIDGFYCELKFNPPDVKKVFTELEEMVKEDSAT